MSAQWISVLVGLCTLLLLMSTAQAATLAASVEAPWIRSLKKALEHGGTQRAKRDRREARRRHVQLATVDPCNGKPSCRTVAFRGFMPLNVLHEDAPKQGGPESSLLMFITDSRSAKVRHIASAHEAGKPSYTECCWWLNEAGVQFRLSGQALLATHESKEPELRRVANLVWDRLGNTTRRTFTWEDPGRPVKQPGEAAEPVKCAKAGAEPDELTPSTATDSEAEGGGAPSQIDIRDAHFAVVVIVPEEVDELRLGGNQKRHLYTLDAAAEQGDRIVDVRTACSWTEENWRKEELNP